MPPWHLHARLSSRAPTAGRRESNDLRVTAVPVISEGNSAKGRLACITRHRRRALRTCASAADSIAHGSLRSGGRRRCAVVPCGPGRRLGAARTASGTGGNPDRGLYRLNLSARATADRSLSQAGISPVTRCVGPVSASPDLGLFVLFPVA